MGARSILTDTPTPWRPSVQGVVGRPWRLHRALGAVGPGLRHRCVQRLQEIGAEHPEWVAFPCSLRTQLNGLLVAHLKTVTGEDFPFQLQGSPMHKGHESRAAQMRTRRLSTVADEDGESGDPANAHKLRSRSRAVPVKGSDSGPVLCACRSSRGPQGMWFGLKW